jgi:hypothetical protein
VSGDIVERLESWETTLDQDALADLLDDAADEIERLRAAGDDMAEALRVNQNRGAASAFMAHRALIRWEEAGRG